MSLRSAMSRFFDRHPTLTVVLASAMLIGVGLIAVGDIVERRGVIPGRFRRQLGIGILAALGWSIILGLALVLRPAQSRSIRRVRSALWVVVFAVGIINAATLYSRAGIDPVDQMEPGIAVTRLALLVWTLAVALVGFLMMHRRSRVERQGWSASDAAPGQLGHHVMIFKAEQVSANESEPAFTALCTCGWSHRAPESLESAVERGRAHDATSEPYVVELR